MVPLALLLALGPRPAFAADPNKPHPHQGALTPYQIPPTPVALTAEEEAVLASKEVLRKQVRFPGIAGGRGVAVMDVHATQAEVLATFRDFPRYVDWIDAVKICEPYKVAGDHVYVHFKLEAAFTSVEYYIDHIWRPDQGFMAWTLDYSRESDLDDSVGYWYVRPHPTRPDLSRVEYSVAVQVSGWVPPFIEDLVANKGLKDATTWLKANAEARHAAAAAAP